ncbi:uncharacterized protein LOC120661648 isoform X1 [Panicum virgatum]|uniref:uncharacterized protein LOC120661648 isoform X1 n=1 Tax=Panicum virgatum TaxID=38727 RepID=UPI0019D65025|nr:uncharacterized protein LOC120661648 isoform X1 [Panicum virgatum]XP_039796489.1 uncharacterized protein LOC120661648 isoform X1 [Panicum virgatum]
MDKTRKRKAAHTGRPPNEQLTNNDSSIPASQLGSFISESLLPSQRVVRQRTLLSSDLPRPESSTAAETRKKRKAAIASGRQEENSEPPLHNRHRRKLLKELFPKRTFRSYLRLLLYEAANTAIKETPAKHTYKYLALFSHPFIWEVRIKHAHIVVLAFGLRNEYVDMDGQLLQYITNAAEEEAFYYLLTSHLRSPYLAF